MYQDLYCFIFVLLFFRIWWCFGCFRCPCNRRDCWRNINRFLCYIFTHSHSLPYWLSHSLILLLTSSLPQSLIQSLTLYSYLTHSRRFLCDKSSRCPIVFRHYCRPTNKRCILQWHKVRRSSTSDSISRDMFCCRMVVLWYLLDLAGHWQNDWITRVREWWRYWSRLLFTRRANQQAKDSPRHGTQANQRMLNLWSGCARLCRCLSHQTSIIKYRISHRLHFCTPLYFQQIVVSSWVWKLTQKKWKWKWKVLGSDFRI